MFQVCTLWWAVDCAPNGAAPGQVCLVVSGGRGRSGHVWTESGRDQTYHATGSWDHCQGLWNRVAEKWRSPQAVPSQTISATESMRRTMVECHRVWLAGVGVGGIRHHLAIANKIHPFLYPRTKCTRVEKRKKRVKKKDNSESLLVCDWKWFLTKKEPWMSLIFMRTTTGVENLP